jgi:hypothetical protein
VKGGFKRVHPLSHMLQRVARDFDPVRAELISGVNGVELLASVRHDRVCPGGRGACGRDIAAQIFPRAGQRGSGSNTIDFASDAVPGECECFGDLKRDVGRATGGTAGTRRVT